ncbi:MAG: acetate--CoA ligase [Chthoniobacterales bacterium]
MNWQPIHKQPAAGAIHANLDNYDRACASFSWEKVRDECVGPGTGRGFNIAGVIDRGATGALRDHLAIRWLGETGATRDFSYAQLQIQANQFANVLRTLGIGKGDRVFVCAPRIPELYITALGALKNRSVFCPIFSAFGPEPVFQRLSRGNAKILVTTTALYNQKIDKLLSRLPRIQYVLLADAHEDLSERCRSFARLMDASSSEFTIPPTHPEDMALLHFTSGTTGMPKGAIHVHNAALMHYVTGKFVLDFHPRDVFWCTADPGWVTGTSYGIIAPLLHGITNVVDEAEFDAERWYRVLQDQKVTVWYTAPTAIRRLMRMNIAPREKFDLSALRLIHSVGEPLNPEAVVWGEKMLGLPIHDNWWQTETGGIMIANFPSMDIRPGSMGKPLPGVEAAIVRRVNDDVEVVTEPNVEGDLALGPGWPSMFRGYLHEEERYRKCFVGGWYITGDLAKRDADGYYWFVGRADDIIKTAGHMVGPFEVENALMEHPAVAEAAVIGKPDPIIGEVVKAFVALKMGFKPSDALRMELLGFGRKRLGSAIAPKEIQFERDLPKTRSGKMMRRLLKAREMGLPEGDISTLEVTT